MSNVTDTKLVERITRDLGYDNPRIRVYGDGDLGKVFVSLSFEIPAGKFTKARTVTALTGGQDRDDKRTRVTETDVRIWASDAIRKLKNEMAKYSEESRERAAELLEILESTFPQIF